MNFIILLSMLVIAPAAWAQIEIYAGGQKYESLESYQVLSEAKRAIQAVPLTGEEKQALVNEAKKLGIEANPDKLKTVIIQPVDKKEQEAVKKLRLLSVNPPDKASILTNPQTWQTPSPLMVRLIQDENLENAIRQAVGQSTSAKMIVAQDNTVKILSLSPAQAQAK